MICACVLLLSLGFLAGANNDYGIEIVPAMYIKEVNDVTTYEATSKLLFHVELPNFDQLRFNAIDCLILPSNITTLNLDFLLEVLQDDFHNQVQQFQEDFQGKRVKKDVYSFAQGAAGDFLLNSALTRVWNFLFGGEDDVKQYVNNLRNSVAENQQSIAFIEQNVTAFANAMREAYGHLESQLKTLHSSQNKFQFAVDTKFGVVLKFLYTKIERDWFTESKYACLQNTIPSKMVPMNTLIARLSELDVRLRAQGKQLAIPVKSNSQYHKLSLVDCVIQKGKVTVVVTVPIKKISSRWTIYEIIHTKFAFEGQVCDLYPQDSSYLAVSKLKSVMITRHMLEHCDLRTQKLCLIPEYTRDSSESLHCAIGMMKGKPVTELVRYCAFRCSTNSELVINQVEPNALVVTNMEYLNVSCPPKNEFYVFKNLGAVELNLQCNCTYVIDKSTVIEAPFYCTAERSGVETVYNIIPNLWSALKSAYGLHSHAFSQLSEDNFDNSWHEKLPVLNLTLPKPKISEPLYYGYSSIQVWLVILSVMVTISLIMNMLILYAYIKAIFLVECLLIL